MTRPSCLGRHAAAAPPNPAQLWRPRPAGRSNPNPNGLAGHRHPLRAHPAAAATPPRRPGGHPPRQGRGSRGIPPEARAPPQRRPGSWRPWPCQGKKYPACGRPPRRRRGGGPEGGASARSAALPAERLPGPRHSEWSKPRRGPPPPAEVAPAFPSFRPPFEALAAAKVSSGRPEGRSGSPPPQVSHCPPGPHPPLIRHINGQIKAARAYAQ